MFHISTFWKNNPNFDRPPNPPEKGHGCRWNVVRRVKIWSSRACAWSFRFGITYRFLSLDTWSCNRSALCHPKNPGVHYLAYICSWPPICVLAHKDAATKEQPCHTDIAYTHTFKHTHAHIHSAEKCDNVCSTIFNYTAKMIIQMKHSCEKQAEISSHANVQPTDSFLHWARTLFRVYGTANLRDGTIVSGSNFMSRNLRLPSIVPEKCWVSRSFGLSNFAEVSSIIIPDPYAVLKKPKQSPYDANSLLFDENVLLYSIIRSTVIDIHRCEYSSLPGVMNWSCGLFDSYGVLEDQLLARLESRRTLETVIRRPMIELGYHREHLQVLFWTIFVPNSGQCFWI